MEMKEIDVSIIVPVCNVEAFLAECLDSVINQTMKNIEIICVNDGSKDSSLEIIKSYQKKDDRVKIISKDNSGYGNTMNVGMDSAMGKYIGIVESDDYVEKNMFQRLYEIAEANQLDFVKSDHYIFSTKQGKKHKEYQAVCPNEYYNRILNAEICPKIFSFAMMNWTGLYRADFIRKYQIRHNETPGASFQDNGFWFQAITLGKRCMFINEAFYYYRQDNPNSSINSKSKVFCICDEYKYIQEFLEKDPQNAEKYFMEFFHKKVFNYLHSYKRIANEFKLSFLEKIALEFESDLNNPYFNKETVDLWIYSMVNRIIDSPKLFYIEDSQFVLKKKYEEVHSLLMKVRSSKEFKKGIKIRKLLRGE